jgi:hypothetical protein
LPYFTNIKEYAIFTGSKFNSEPHRHGHDAVMNNMEGSNMIVLFSQHEEKRICEFDELGNIVPPATMHHAHR